MTYERFCLKEAVLLNRVIGQADPKRYSFRPRSIVVGLTMLAAATALSACNTSQVLNQGYIIDQSALEATPVGSSREQVLLSLGTPSTTQTIDSNEVFYYISQQRKRGMAFQKTKLVGQSVLAVYLDQEGTVSRIANYTLQDGKVFDMISRTTPTGGTERGFLAGVLGGFTGT
jgi:outer membrane protein assembly factor BamE (lipoprotein component of BamABCDE complex)